MCSVLNRPSCCKYTAADVCVFVCVLVVYVRAFLKVSFVHNLHLFIVCAYDVIEFVCIQQYDATTK